MNNELLDLADRLCMVAGMIMEDNNLRAVSTPASAVARVEKLETLSNVGDDIAALMRAAQILVRIG